METIDFKHEIYMVYTSLCTLCRNRFDKKKYTCLAFPDGIPDEILRGEDKHLNIAAGQKNKVVFQDMTLAPKDIERNDL